MMRGIATLLIVALLAGLASTGVCEDPQPPAPPAPPPPAKKAPPEAKDAKPQPHRVGNIYIVGNKTVPDGVILAILVELRPGGELRYPAIRLGELRLASSGLFVNDPPQDR